jgi:hypothetical protein
LNKNVIMSKDRGGTIFNKKSSLSII